VSTPVTTIPPTTIPPTTLPPATSPQINRGPGNGNGNKGGRDVQEQFRKWLEELQNQFRNLQNGE
jgi:hypothetical protein